MSMKNSNDTIGNRTRNLPACSAVPQPTAPPLAPIMFGEKYKLFSTTLCCFLQSQITASLSGPCIILSTVLSKQPLFLS